MGDTCTVGNEHEHVCVSASGAYHGAGKAWRAAGEENFGRFKWFRVRFQRFVSPLPTPCRRLLFFSENGLVAFVNGTVC